MNSGITVIIPVYKAENFIAKAVESALMQPEVKEILLIEDQSPDNSLAICNDFMEKFPEKIKVFTHDHNISKGAASSRNLGILNAKFEILAFLDADDYYLPNRFKKAVELLHENPEVDGVYEAIGTHYYDEKGKELHQRRMADLKIKDLNPDLTTLTKVVSSDSLFESLIMGNIGWFHFNGLTLRKSAVAKTGMLDPFLWYGQDIDFFLRLSIYTKLIPGDLNNPVAMRGVYFENSTLSIYTSSERLFMNQRAAAYRWKKMYKLMLKNDFPIRVNRFLLNRYIDHIDDEMMNGPINFKRKLIKFKWLLTIIFRYPETYKKVVG